MGRRTRRSRRTSRRLREHHHFRRKLTFLLSPFNDRLTFFSTTPSYRSFLQSVNGSTEGSCVVCLPLFSISEVGRKKEKKKSDIFSLEQLGESPQNSNICFSSFSPSPICNKNGIDVLLYVHVCTTTTTRCCRNVRLNATAAISGWQAVMVVPGQEIAGYIFRKGDRLTTEMSAVSLFLHIFHSFSLSKKKKTCF